MTTALLLGLMLAFEPTERAIMTRPPRDPRKPILIPGFILRILIVSAIMAAGGYWIFDHIVAAGGSAAEARTVVVNVVVFTEMFYLLNCRSLTRSPWTIGFLANPWLIVGCLAMTALQMVLTYVPIMNRWFETSPITAIEWLKILGVGILAYAIIELEKRIQSALRA